MKYLVAIVVASLFLSATSSAAPTTDAPAQQDSTTTTPLPETTSVGETTTSTTKPDLQHVGEANPKDTSHEDHIKTSFTCFGRSEGYHADVEHSCKIYHFCMLGEYNGESVYQRITYMCLKDTIFDEKKIECVEPSKISAPCRESPHNNNTLPAVTEY